MIPTLIIILFLRESATTTPPTVRCSVPYPQYYYTTKNAACKHSFIPICADALRQNGDYYENILGMVIKEINAGTFDSYGSGQEIINAVAKDKSKWLSD